MKYRFFLALTLTGAAVVICASAFFEPSHTPAAALPKNLTTALVANDTVGLENPNTCHLIPGTPEPASSVTPVSDIKQCPEPQPGDICGPHCVVDIKESTPVGDRDPRTVLKNALLRCNTTVRLGPHVSLDFSDLPKDWFSGDSFSLGFGQCVTLTSVNDFDFPTSEARTPRAPGPELKYGPHRTEADGSFLAIRCDDADRAPSDHVRISGFRLIGPSPDQQSTSDVGIRNSRCIDVEISNMEITGWGAVGIVVENQPREQSHRINDFSQVRIHDNFIHHNQHPEQDGALGYGVESSVWGARTHIYRNVFDFNRHAISAGGKSGGYVAEENLVLKGGGYHGSFFNGFTHIFDVHGSDKWCFIWCASGFGGQAGEEFRFYRNSFQYRSDNAIKIRGLPRDKAWIGDNIFPHDTLTDHWIWEDNAIELYTISNVEIGPSNITKTDTFGEYWSQCDFDGDRIDDLFLATGATWWYSSSGTFHWTFLNTSSTRLTDLRFGYFDDDDRCDVLTESGSGHWLISSGGTAPWKPLEQVWRPQPLEGVWKPLKDVRFGRFDPRDHRHNRQTTHAFYRKENGEWWVMKLSDVGNLSDPNSAWKYVGGSHKPLSELQFGDFTGDGVTDVLAVERGRWAYSESARKRWRTLNRSLGDSVAGLLIANMDSDDEKDDILRFQVRSSSANDSRKLIWWRSKDGVDRWREFKKYSFKYHTSNVDPAVGYVVPKRGFVGRFGAMSGATLIINGERRGHFFSQGHAEVPPTEWTSWFPY